MPELTVVEVLPAEAYHEFHIAGAINVPIDDKFDSRIQDSIPDKSNPVIVYCQDVDCNASPKAAKRMDELGYRKVYDYEAGKVDWQRAGMPTE